MSDDDGFDDEDDEDDEGGGGGGGVGLIVVDTAMKAWNTSSKDFPTPTARQHPV